MARMSPAKQQFLDELTRKYAALPSHKIQHDRLQRPLPETLNQRLNNLAILDDLPARPRSPHPEPANDTASTAHIGLPPSLLEAERAANEAAISVHVSLNPSTITAIAEHPDNLKLVDLHITPPHVSRQPESGAVHHHWAAQRVAEKSREKRVAAWHSKLDRLYHKHHDGMGLAEEAGARVKWATEDFAEFLQLFHVEGRQTMDLRTIREMFAIDAGNEALQAVYVEPERVRAIPDEVAQSLRMRRKSIDWQVYDMLFGENSKITPCDRKKRRRKRYAFGRTIPLEEFDAGKPDENIPAMRSNFPRDLRSAQVVFEGTEHLGAVKMLVRYLRKHPEKPRPAYLLQYFSFAEDAVSAASHDPDYVPLHKLFCKKIY